MSKTNISSEEFHEILSTPDSDRKLEELAKDNDKNTIGGKDPIAWAVDNGLRIGNESPVTWAAKHNKKIDGQDPIVWGMNHKNFERSDLIAYAARSEIKIEGKDAIIWAIENDKQIKDKDPLTWAVDNHNKIENKDPIAWAIDKQAPINDTPPLIWAIENKKDIERNEPIVYAAKNGILVESKSRDPQDPCLYALELGIKAKWGHFEIDAVELAYNTKSPESFKEFHDTLLANQSNYPQPYLSEALENIKDIKESDDKAMSTAMSTEILPDINKFIETHISKGTVPTADEIEALGQKLTSKAQWHSVKLSIPLSYDKMSTYP